MVGHSPVFQILLQIAVRMSAVASAPAWTNSAGMLSTSADFPIFRALTAASICSRRIELSLHLVSVGSQVLLGPHQSHSCKGLISYSVHLLRILFSSVRHFPDLSCMVVDLPCFSVVRSLTGWYAFLLLFFLRHASTAWH